MQTSGDTILVNLASSEYYKAVVENSILRVLDKYFYMNGQALDQNGFAAIDVAAASPSTTATAAFEILFPCIILTAP